MAPPIDNLDELKSVSVGLAGGLLAIVSALILHYQVAGIPATPHAENTADGVIERKAEKIRQRIADGASAFLMTEFKYLIVYLLVIGGAQGAILIRDTQKEYGVYVMICFWVGGILSATSAYLGMYMATFTNSRTTLACRQSMKRGLEVSFASGAFVANIVVGFGIIGLAVLYLFFQEEVDAWNYLAGFGFGASSIALFARVGGGVFTKAADVGSDLVGKVEEGIPEDDPRNPAVIADNVGDNVGDVAGMGADLFESYVSSIIAACNLAPAAFDGFIGNELQPVSQAAIALPFWISGFGIIVALFGVAYIRCKSLPDGATLEQLLGQINGGINLAAILMCALSFIICNVLFDYDVSWRLFGCVNIGLLAGVLIGLWTEYITSYEHAPTKGVTLASTFGGAPVIIKGLGIGMLSVVVPVVLICITIVACNALQGMYGISIAAVGMLSTLGVTLATDAYGPVADNAGGIAEMVGLPSEIRTRTDALDSLGNTTAATGKGFAVGSAILTSVSLIGAFMEQAGLSKIPADLKEPIVMTGVLFGCMLPFLFCALSMLSVDRVARSIITEVRLQFAQCPELLQIKEGEGDITQTFTKEIGGKTRVFPDSTRCVEITTSSAVKEMIAPGLLAIFSPVVIGYLIGPLGLAGMLGGALAGSFMLAVTMANAGGSWDNAKKYVEKCANEGEVVGANAARSFTTYGIKKASLLDNVTVWAGYVPEGQTAPETDSERAALADYLLDLYEKRHSAAVTGDTVGDPFKDTSGPSLNILIKLMSVVSLVLAPTYRSFDEPRGLMDGSDAFWIGLVVLAVVSFFLWIIKSNIDAAESKRSEEARLALKAAREANGVANASNKTNNAIEGAIAVAKKAAEAVARARKLAADSNTNLSEDQESLFKAVEEAGNFVSAAAASNAEEAAPVAAEEEAAPAAAEEETPAAAEETAAAEAVATDDVAVAEN